MNSRIDESLLLGYLMNSLEPDELAQIEQAIDADPSVRERLEKLRIDFQGLLETSSQDMPEPRGDLAALTLEAINDGSRRRELQRPSSWARFCEKTKFLKAMSAEDSDARGGIGLFRSAVELSVLAVCILVFGVVILSNTHFAREHARQQRCSYQMLNIGLAIQDYAFHGQNQVAPEIEADGPLSFAGVYAPRLNERMLLSDEDSLLCPSDSSRIEALTSNSIRSLPTIRQLMNAQLEELEMWKRWIGGSYAYNLGVINQGQYRMPRYLSRPEFAILGDSPQFVEDRLEWSSHGRNRCNILYEDGRVVLRVCGPDVDFPNHPYLNEKGELKAGCNDNDSALGPSFFGPMDNVEVYRVRFDK